MPTIAWFYGIASRMYVKDHPPSHGPTTWPNGFDIAPDWLRREMVEAKELALTA